MKIYKITDERDKMKSPTLEGADQIIHGGARICTAAPRIVSI